MGPNGGGAQPQLSREQQQQRQWQQLTQEQQQRVKQHQKEQQVQGQRQAQQQEQQLLQAQRMEHQGYGAAGSSASAGPPGLQEGMGEPPSYTDAIRGDNKLQTQT